jgi:hypothetical protein
MWRDPALVYSTFGVGRSAFSSVFYRAGFFAFASFAHSSAHLRQASAQRENATTFECLSHAAASSSQACAHTPQIG